MRRRILRSGCAGLLALGLVGLEPVAAQMVVMPSGRQRIVPPDRVLATLRSQGFNPLERPIRRGVTYALRAVDPDGDKVRVIVDARVGTILAVTPLQPQSLTPGPSVAVAPPIAPGPNIRRVPNAPPDADVMVEPLRRVAPSGPTVIYEPDPPVVYGSPPPAQVPPPTAAMRPPDVGPPGPQIIAPEPNPGMLPPPPERFPQRVAPTRELKRKPAPPRRAVSAVLPKSPPLPRPKPEATIGQPPPAAAPAALPSATPPVTPAPAAKSSPADLPN